MKLLERFLLSLAILWLATGVERAVNNQRAEATLLAIAEAPSPFERGGPSLMVKLSGASQPRLNGWRHLSTGWFFMTTNADRALFGQLRPGCRYDFEFHRDNPRGSGEYSIVGARLMGCAAGGI